MANGDYPRTTEDTAGQHYIDAVMNRGFAGDSLILETERWTFGSLAAAAMGQVNQQITSNNTADRVLMARLTGGQPQTPADYSGVNQGGAGK